MFWNAAKFRCEMLHLIPNQYFCVGHHSRSAALSLASPTHVGSRRALKGVTAVELNGDKESFALLQIHANPPPIEAFSGLGLHAIAFSGEVDLAPTWDTIEGLQKAADDIDDSVSLEVDIVVGPKWREVKQAAPLTVVTNALATNADTDDQFQFACNFRNPKWSVKDLGGHERIVLHVTITQAGEYV